MAESKTKGIPTAVFRRADGREFYLHSRYDPLEEARFLVQDLPRRERTLYVALGFGLGYHIKEMLQRIPQNSHVAVVEPGFACLSAKLLAAEGDRATAWMHDNRLHFLTHRDPQVVPLSLVDRLTALRLLSLELITHIPSAMTAEEFYRTLLTEIPQKFPSGFQSHLGSLDKLLENPLRNFWANLLHSWNGAPVQCLRGKWAGRALVIVSAGPSLTQALPTLREFRGDALLLATGTAARILMGNDIRPDLVVSIDPYEANLAHFQGWPTAEVPLVCSPRIHREIMASYSGQKFIFALQEDPPIPMSPFPAKSDFWQGGSVAFSALQLAHYLNANPIIFVGQDFAFANGHTHADGCIVDSVFDANALPPDCFLIPGADGNPVVTNRIYYSYLLYMQDYLSKFAGQMPDVKHINTSASGAKIEGMEYLDLKLALALQPPGTQVPPSEMINSACKQGQRIPREAQKTIVGRWTNELDQLLGRAAHIGDFDRLFSKFKATSLYAHAARSYDDIYYLFEAKCRNEENSTTPAFLDRFRGHLQLVLAELRRIGLAV